MEKTRSEKKSKKNDIKDICRKLSEINLALKRLKDDQFKELARTGFFDKLLLSIMDPKESKKYNALQDFFLDNKNRLSVMAGLRNAITENYSFKGNVNDVPIFVSPFPYQWLDNGVIFLQGKEKFLGLIGFYDLNKDLYFARSKRDFKPGDNIDLKEDLFFDIIYQKINSDKSLDSEQKRKVINKLEEIKEEKNPKKRELILKSIKDILGRAWYLSNKAFWDSLLGAVKGPK